MAKSNLSYEDLLKRLEQSKKPRVARPPVQEEEAEGAAELLARGPEAFGQAPESMPSAQDMQMSKKPDPSAGADLTPMAVDEDMISSVKKDVQDVKDGRDFELEKARRNDAIMDMIGGLGQAGQMFASAASRNHYKPDYDLFKNTRSNTENLLQDRKAREDNVARKQTFDRAAAGSDSSKNLRDLLSKYTGKKLPDTMSYSDLMSSQLPATMISAHGKDAALQARIDAMQNSNHYRDAMLGLKKDQIEGAAERGEVRTNGQVMSMLQREAKVPLQSLQFGQNALHYANAMLSGKVKPTIQDLNTLAAEEAKLAVGNSGTLADRQKYQNDALAAYKAAAEQRFSGNPTAVANSEAFIKQRVDGINTMMEGHARNLEIARDSIKEGLSDPKRKEALDRMVESKLTGYAPEKPAGKSLSPAQLDDYAKKHNISAEEAQKFLADKGFHVKD